MSADVRRTVEALTSWADGQAGHMDEVSVKNHVHILLDEHDYRDALVSEIEDMIEKTADYAAEIERLKARADWLEAKG